MDKLLNLLADFLKGQSMATTLRRLLSLLLTLNLTSYLFVHFVGPYSIEELLSLRSLLDAFVSGAYLIPIGLFAVAHYLIEWTAVAIFHGLNYVATVALTRWLIKQQWTQAIIRLWLRRLYWFSRFTPRPLNSEMAEQVLLEMKQELTQEVLLEIKIGLTEPIRTAEIGFVLFFRMIVTITVYASVFADVSDAFFWLVFSVLAVAMLISIVGVTILKVVPTALARFRHECDTILAIVQRGLGRPTLSMPAGINRLIT